LEHYRNECNDLHNRLRQQDDQMNCKLKESMLEVNDVSYNKFNIVFFCFCWVPSVLETLEFNLKCYYKLSVH